MTPLVLRHEFQPMGVYLDSATYGLPPKAALQALSAVTAAWASGRAAVSAARRRLRRVHDPAGAARRRGR
jgi:hypothetical protein